MANDSIRGRQVVLRLTNKSGGALVEGDVVIISSGTAAAITTTTTAGLATDVVGVCLESIGVDAIGRVCVSGYVPKINLSGAASLGDTVATHSVAKQAAPAGTRAAGHFGEVLGTGTTPAALLWGAPDSGSGSGGATAIIPGGRLTLTTATPVTTADVNGATTLYYTPYIHNYVQLYDGAAWQATAFTEKSITMVGATASKPYDVWGYLSGGALALEKLIWTDATNRATALAYQDGRLVKSGDATRLYLGTIYCNSSGGQTDDSITKRFVWNYYNRIMRMMKVIDTTDGWTYNNATYRPMNNSTANRVEYVKGVSETPVYSHCILSTLVDANEAGNCGIGIDSTSVNSAILFGEIATSLATNFRASTQAIYEGHPGVGYHYIQALESARAGDVYFYGDLGTASVQSGLIAKILG